MSYRVEKDEVGEINVPNDRYWAAQTQRNIENFSIGTEKVPMEIIKAFAYIKKSCAIVNTKQNKLSKEKAAAILQTCDEIINSELDDNFPLVIWQSGSKLQINMNVNEVIAIRATQILGVGFDDNLAVCSKKDVNYSQDSNDIYSSAIRISYVLELENRLIPALKDLKANFKKKALLLNSASKEDKVDKKQHNSSPEEDEIDVYIQMLKKTKKHIKQSLKYLKELSICKNDEQNNLDEPKNFAKMISTVINKQVKSKHKFKSHHHKSHKLTSYDAEVMISGTLNALASNLMKIAYDNKSKESEIVDKDSMDISKYKETDGFTQYEAISMVCAQIMGNHTTISVAASQGNFEQGIFKPVIAYNLLQSIRLLSDVLISFNDNLILLFKAEK